MSPRSIGRPEAADEPACRSPELPSRCPEWIPKNAIKRRSAWSVNALTLVELHPYEYLFYNPLLGGLQGASRRYVLDYWFDSMPVAVHELEAYGRTDPVGAGRRPARVYSVAVCGSRLPFEKTVTLLQLRYDFMPRWDQSQFFIAPTDMNCDRDLDGKVVGTVKCPGVAIAYVKDRRALTGPATR